MPANSGRDNARSPADPGRDNARSPADSGRDNARSHRPRTAGWSCAGRSAARRRAGVENGG